MAKSILTTSIYPSYDDLPEDFYHFSKKYLSQVKKTIGDWIVYYEPSRTGKQPVRRVGRKAYFAIAQVVRIRKDKKNKDHYYADVSGYMEFPRSVPFREDDHFYESALRNPHGQTATGVFQNAVRTIPDEEYNLILQAGYASILTEQSLVTTEPNQPGLMEEQQILQRPIIEQVTKRPFHDVVFIHNIRKAYDSTCAITGLKLINGGGRCEIEAAHIRPVGNGHAGPDSIRNGLALSRTFHWMFDRGLISLTNDHKILTAENFIPNQVQGMLPLYQKIQIPNNPALQPHPHFLKYHRDTIFKG